MRKPITPLEVIREWWRGCSNTRPFERGRGPWRCGTCTRGMLRALWKSLLS